MTADSPLQFRKTRDGKWAAFGPRDCMGVGVNDVLKRDGTVQTVTVERISKPCKVDGVICAYGFIAEKAKGRTSARTHSSERGGRGRVQCMECDAWFTAGGQCTECGGC